VSFIYELIEIMIMSSCTRWPVVVPPYSQIDVVVVHEAYLSCVKDAWQYLLKNGKGHATDSSIRPEDLILGKHFLVLHDLAMSLLTHYNSDPRWNPSKFLC